MSNWGISPNASEKEKIKADYADILHGMNSTGVIPYDVYSDLFDDGMELFDRMYEQGKADAIEMALKEAPTIEAEPVRHGRWVEGVPYICSECGKPAPEEENNSEYYKCWLSPYCPHCGAKMDGGADQ
jgi:DNA-directed RNA polymerase subunit RPC12/RpoP